MLTVEFVLDGQEYTAINGGPEFHFDEAISLRPARNERAMKAMFEMRQLDVAALHAAAAADGP